MFKFLLISSLLTLGHVLADNEATITRFGSQINFDGSYAYDVAQSDGLELRESGVGGQFANGAFEYYSPEGEHVQVAYKANEYGFQPDSERLPTPPPIPDYVFRAIEYIRNNPTAEELADQQKRATQYNFRF